MTGSQSPGQTLRGDGPDLGNLDPGPLGQCGFHQLQCQRESSFGLRAGQRNDDNCPGPVVEGRAAENQNGPPARLPVTECWIKVSPINVSSQYAGHSV